MKRILILLLIISILPTASIFAYNSEAQLTFIVKSSSQSLFQSELTIESDELFQSIIILKSRRKVTELPLSNHYLLLENKGMIKTYMIDYRGELYDIQRKEKIQIPSELERKLRTYFQALDSKHFGKLMYWEEGQELIPRYSKFKITDLETGLSFHVQRRAGSNHADVQPLTKKDTKIMKEIYNGKWSWKRRAVLIHCNNQIIAASMHGMPHGGGALANGFPGHFCIHLKGSTTHTSRSEDLSHQVMVHKAAGILNSYVKQLQAEDIVELFFVAINQRDYDLLNLIHSGTVESHNEIINRTESIRILKRDKISLKEPLVYKEVVKYKVKEEGKGESVEQFSFELVRDSITSGWKLVKVPF
ncbi:hypothetical protein [Bacillus sp. FJAT-45350]|uniref:hypothetical protein n=1 Tax=Bacillus sp. FJAT-45350 TaxID=2011014 RepID=UPI000BB6A768|nr:hypothetical protein [Bacillus sp. FJAT-45350]